MTNTEEAILEKLKNVIECDGTMTITLNQKDLKEIYSVILHEHLYKTKLQKAMNTRDTKDIDAFCEAMKENRRNLIANTEAVVQTIMEKILDY